MDYKDIPEITFSERKLIAKKKKTIEDVEVRCICSFCYAEGWTFVSHQRALELEKEELMEEACPFGDRCTAECNN